jgi:hypothetical protein
MTDVDDETWVDLADHRPDVYEEDGQRVYRASSFGSCESALVRHALGHTPGPPPAFMLDKFEESAKLEAPILDALSEGYGWASLRPAELRLEWGEVDGTGQLVSELKVPGGIIRCHPDAIAKCYRIKKVRGRDDLPYKLGDNRVVEVKALKSGSNAATMRNYQWQFAIEMAATKLPGIFVTGWKDDNGELEIDEETGLPRLTVAYYSKPPFSLGEIKLRARRLDQLIRAAEEGDGLPPCDYKMFPCGFWADHPDDGIWAKAEVPEDDGVANLLEGYGDALARLDNAKAEVDGYKAKLHQYVVTAEIEGKVAGGGWTVERIVRKGSVTVDRKAAEAAGLELGPYLKTGKGSDYVKIEKVAEDG